MTARILNIEATLTRFGGDEQLFREMAAILLDDAPPLAEELKQAVERRDAASIRAKAHALKGLVLGCGGERAGQAAQQIEDAGHHAKLEHVDAQFIELEQELQQLLAAIRSNVGNSVTA
ncbi:MAG: Hpt domain-containing protein [Pirellulales bacterium]